MNRLGGRLFMGAGVLAIVGTFLPPMVGFLFILFPALIILPITYVYSMRLYRQLHPDAMEPPAPLAMPGDDDVPAEKLIPQTVAGEAVAPSTRIEVTCPACRADNAPGNRECICCGKPLSAA